MEQPLNQDTIDLNISQNNNYNNNNQNIQKLKIGTFNILFEAHYFGIKQIQQSKKRYLYQINTIFKEENFDILCLNEVTRHYYKNYLQKSDYILNTYELSIQMDQYDQMRGLFNIILVKKQLNLTPYFYMAESRSVFAFIKYQNQAFILGNLHLCAREHLKHVREKQIKNVKTQLKEFQYYIHNQLDKKEDKQLFQETLQNNNIFLCGDFNFHLQSETHLLYKHNYIDCYLEQLQKDSNFELNLSQNDQREANDVNDANRYSWDAQKNSFLKLLMIFDNRRMRLDRMAIHKLAANLSFDNFEMFANKKIPGSCYLTPSDHYGLKLILNISKKKFVKQLNYLNQNQISQLQQQPDLTGFRTLKKIIKIRIFSLILLAISLIAITTLGILYF